MSDVGQALPSIEREVALRVDFELLHDDGCVWISTRFRHSESPRRPVPGDTVYLIDDAGRGCVGHVEQCHGWYLCVLPDWDTWNGGPLPAGAHGGEPRAG